MRVELEQISKSDTGRYVHPGPIALGCHGVFYCEHSQSAVHGKHQARNLSFHEEVNHWETCVVEDNVVSCEADTSSPTGRHSIGGCNLTKVCQQHPAADLARAHRVQSY